jgi:hypothetical protein
MTTALNTPLPWTLQMNRLMSGETYPGRVVDQNEETIRVTGFALSGGGAAEANSAFIVKACNDYASLRSRADAVPMLVELLRESHDYMIKAPAADIGLLARLETAIAQVTPLLADSERPKPFGLPSDTPSNTDVRATDSGDKA